MRTVRACRDPQQSINWRAVALASSAVAAMVVMVLPASVSATSAQRRPATASIQTPGPAAPQLSVVSLPVGQTTEWEVPADVEYVAVNLCAGAPTSGATSPCVSAKVKVTEGQVLSTLVGTMGRPSSILDRSRPAGSRSLIAIGPSSARPVVGSTDVTEVAVVTPTAGSGSDGSASLWLPPAPVHVVARPVKGDGSALNVLYTLHVVQNAAANVYRGVGPVLFPTDITGVEYSIDGGSTWQHSGGPPPAAGSAGTFSIRNLTPDTAYTVLVRAVNGAGPGIQGSSTATTSRLPTPSTTIATTTSTTHDHDSGAHDHRGPHDHCGPHDTRHDDHRRTAHHPGAQHEHDLHIGGALHDLDVGRSQHDHHIDLGGSHHRPRGTDHGNPRADQFGPFDQRRHVGTSGLVHAGRVGRLVPGRHRRGRLDADRHPLRCRGHHPGRFRHHRRGAPRRGRAGQRCGRHLRHTDGVGLGGR